MKNKLSLLTIILLISTTIACSKQLNYTFPLDNYNQSIDFWFNKTQKDYYEIQLPINVQKKYFKEFKSAYFGEMSPWSEKGVNKILSNLHDITRLNWVTLNTLLDNHKQNIENPEDTRNTLYGRNLRRLDINWFNKLYNNINFEELKSTTFNKSHRAIATKNIMVLSIPSEDPIFNNSKFAGRGYPFNLANVSYASASTPLYIISTTKDKAWYFVITPVLNGWVKAEDVALVNDDFVNIWTKKAYKSIAGITTSNLPIILNKNFMFSALVGTVFPVHIENTKIFTVLVAAKNNSTGYAEIHYVNISKNDAALIPLAINMHNFSRIIKTLIGRSYGWGGMDFYNDCSLEIISIYNIFGILLPRNSKAQSDKFYKNNIDISSLSLKERYKAITKYAVPFASFIRIPGHIMIYIGSYNSKYGKDTIMVYHDVWGLQPKKGADSRYIIGQSVILPILDNYKEIKDTGSLIGKKTVTIVNLIPKFSN